MQEQFAAKGEKIGQRVVVLVGKNRHKSKRLNWSAFAEKMNELDYG